MEGVNEHALTHHERIGHMAERTNVHITHAGANQLGKVAIQADVFNVVTVKHQITVDEQLAAPFIQYQGAIAGFYRNAPGLPF